MSRSSASQRALAVIDFHLIRATRKGECSDCRNTNNCVRRTHIANVDRDYTTGRKIINHYEVIEEIGRGVHGKVKLARDLDNGHNVAIKIVPRFSKKRRLGRITQNVSPFEKTKREIAILKKIRHPNVVALLEVIDDPDYKKIYLCLEHVECGEVMWRVKGVPEICAFERRRIEREMRGESLSEEEEAYILNLERRYNLKERKRAHMAEKVAMHGTHWSLELGQEDASRHSDADGMDVAVGSLPSSSPANVSAPNSQGPSRNQSVGSMAAAEPNPTSPSIDDDDDDETPGPQYQQDPITSSNALDGTMYGAYDDILLRGRSPSMADSIISHMSSIDFNQTHDPLAEDYSYVPCFTIDEARGAFRDVVLGLQYLHYQGIVHRDIKPANLLWTRDHTIKISDFGVSYFGRPMREFEPDETVSESEAQDFDDELELSKTVGTPAFFAPELCYTDLDAGPPPRISEKIDIWSLGVTLYGMIFGRVPFSAVDEFHLFRKIATEVAYIPKKRLRPVDPSTSPKASSIYNRENGPPYRDDHELVYEDVDENLRDLLDKMLTKDPRKRIDLRGVKQHPWILAGMTNQIGWIDDTDPSRQTEGRKIQLTDKDLHDAVVPLTLLERARSTIKKTLTKWTGSRSNSERNTDRGDDSSRRRRATSSAASSAGDSPAYTPGTPHLRESRRKSLRGDADYFAPAREQFHPQSDHPLTYSVTASPDETTPPPPLDTGAAMRNRSATGDRYSRRPLEIGAEHCYGGEDIAERQTPTPSRYEFPRRHRHSHSVSNAVLALQNTMLETQTAPTTPATETHADGFSGLLRKGRDGTASCEDSARSQSVDRALVFNSQDKRAQPKVSLSTMVAPGNLEQPKRLQQMRSLDLSRRSGEQSLHSPLLFSPHAVSAYHAGPHRSEPSLDKFQTVIKVDERPLTAHRVQDLEGKTPPPRIYGSSTPESFARAQEIQRRRERLEYAEESQQSDLQPPAEIDAAKLPCPPSPDDDDFVISQAPSREETISTTFSSKSNSGDAIGTPFTSPSVVTSPVSCTTSMSHKDLADAVAFQSDPSLPALASGASSVSAEPEGDLKVPTSVSRGSVLETTDSLTPPAFEKEPVAGFPLEESPLDDPMVTVVRVSDHISLDSQSTHSTHSDDEDEGESDSEDEGLLMMGRRSKKSHASKGSPKNTFASRRRGTNASVGSTDTAKKVALASAAEEVSTDSA